jgi:uncharacterized protein
MKGDVTEAGQALKDEDIAGQPGETRWSELTDRQREALVALAGISGFSALAPWPADRPIYRELVALGLAVSRGEGLGGEGFAPSPEGRRLARPRSSKISRRGFASQSPERRREIAAAGGRAVPADQRSFSKDRHLAAEAGRAGGRAGPRRRDKSSDD